MLNNFDQAKLRQTKLGSDCPRKKKCSILGNSGGGLKITLKVILFKHIEDITAQLGM